MEKLNKKLVKDISFYKIIMDCKISYKILNDASVTQINFNKTNNLINYEIYGNQNFFYNGKVESNSNNIFISFETPKDTLLFVKIIEFDYVLKSKNVHTKFIDYKHRTIKKNLSMEITPIDEPEEDFNLSSLNLDSSNENSSDNDDSDNSDNEDSESDSEKNCD